jgi:protein-L-isoaspartate(D-aspartate) O-methyltransferase
MNGRRTSTGMRKASPNSKLALLFAVAATVAACDGAVAERQSSVPDWTAVRMQMVDEQIAARDIKNPRVLEAMRRVPRHEFVPEAMRGSAYSDSPLPIGHDQTISQPFIVAYMTEALELDATHRVLEIGTGSGYQAAVLGELAKAVYTIEILEPLADRARQTLSKLGYKNVHVRTGNGYLGWPEQAPFDRVMVTAAPDAVPPALIEQLKIGGLMAIPVGVGVQELRILRRTASGLETLRTLPVRFVPMTGKPKP